MLLYVLLAGENNSSFNQAYYFRYFTPKKKYISLDMDQIIFISLSFQQYAKFLQYVHLTVLKKDWLYVKLNLSRTGYISAQIKISTAAAWFRTGLP